MTTDRAVGAAAGDAGKGDCVSFSRGVRGGWMGSASKLRLAGADMYTNSRMSRWDG